MSPHLSRVALSTALLCIYFGCLQLGGAHAEIRARSRNSNAAQNVVANVASDKAAIEKNSPKVTESVAASANGNQNDDTAANVVNSDLIDKFSWKCANNASCLYSLANGLVQSYKRGETIKLGLFDLVKLAPKAGADTNAKATKPKWASSETGRSIATFVDFISGNAIRIPVGPMVFSVQRAEDDSDYIEVALLKKANNQGRGDDGLFGGGGGGIGGGGGGLRNRRHHDKKQFQMFIPMYLAATTFGWTLVAAKAVGLLTLKALIISKVAFLVAAMVLVKKFMDNAHEKMMYQFPEHTPYMMPYTMEYPIHAMGGGEIATNDMYPAALHLAAASPLAHHAHPGVESLGAESNLHHNLAEVHNNTQVLAALNAVGLGQKVKREDSWMAKAPAAVRRPMVYNYLQPHNPFYRAKK